jgi:excisionase family DNA binding protein
MNASPTPNPSTLNLPPQPPPPPVDKQEPPSASLGEVLTTPEAAQFIKIHPDTLTKLCRDGKIPHGVIGREYRFSRHALLAWLAQPHEGSIKHVLKLKDRPVSQIIAYVRAKGGNLELQDGKLFISGLRLTPILKEALQSRLAEIMRELAQESPILHQE